MLQVPGGGCWTRVIGGSVWPGAHSFGIGTRRNKVTGGGGGTSVHSGGGASLRNKVTAGEGGEAGSGCADLSARAAGSREPLPAGFRRLTPVAHAAGRGLPRGQAGEAGGCHARATCDPLRRQPLPGGGQAGAATDP